MSYDCEIRCLSSFLKAANDNCLVLSGIEFQNWIAANMVVCLPQLVRACGSKKLLFEANLVGLEFNN